MTEFNIVDNLPLSFSQSWSFLKLGAQMSSWDQSKAIQGAAGPEAGFDS